MTTHYPEDKTCICANIPGFFLAYGEIKGGWGMVFNATCSNISVISWRSVLLVEETGVPAENHQPDASH